MDYQQLFTETVAHYLGPIKKYLDDPTVSEIMINHSDEIYIERDGRIRKTSAAFADQEAYDAAVNNILQFTRQTISEDKPLIDSRLPDGSRVHVARQPCSRFGTAMTIRKFSKSMLDVDWLIQLGSLSEPANEYLKVAIRSERNLLVAGGTSSGKTSLLNALSKHIPRRERIVVIEDSAELQLQQDHVISMETKAADQFGRGGVAIRDLFRSSLRLRPDRIIIGEVRGGEALDMIQAMTSGHGGSMGTLHANNPRDALGRLETMALMSKVELPLFALRAQISSALDVIVQMSRHIGGKRMVTQISEIDPLDDSGQYQLRDIFHIAPVATEDGDKDMQLVWTGERSALAGRVRPDEEKIITAHTKKLFDSPAVVGDN